LLSFTAYSQKNEIKEAQKELNNGNSVQALAVLSPVEYLINNAPDEYRVHFYFIKGNALLDLANNKVNVSKNLSQAVNAFNDLIQIESESGKIKYTPEALTALITIKKDLVNSANDDVVSEKNSESSEKFYQAYLLDKSDTLQLYNAALSYKNSNQNDLALKCFEELKTINYSGDAEVYIAYNKQKLMDETFVSKEDRDLKVHDGTHLKPRQESHSKKADIYKNIALIYVQSGYKEKAMKAIALAIKFNPDDNSLAFMEANLYLETKDYEFFDKLAAAIIENNPNNAELVSNLGIGCQNEKYYEGAEYYFKKAIEIDPQYSNAYVNLSALLIEKGILMTTAMSDLGTSVTDKKNYEDLKLKRESVLKSVVPYLQKVVVIDPNNSRAKQLLSTLNNVINIQSKSIASDY
jgi:tetratricopeptide (TPR) repeat protein